MGGEEEGGEGGWTVLTNPSLNPVWRLCEQSVLVAIIVPNEITVRAWAATNGVPGTTLQDWVGVEALEKAVAADVLRVGKEARVRVKELSDEHTI